MEKLSPLMEPNYWFFWKHFINIAPKIFVRLTTSKGIKTPMILLLSEKNSFSHFWTNWLLSMRENTFMLSNSNGFFFVDNEVKTISAGCLLLYGKKNKSYFFEYWEKISSELFKRVKDFLCHLKYHSDILVDLISLGAKYFIQKLFHL